MDRISQAFNHKPVFMPYFTIGYPDYQISIDVIETLSKNGADLIEVGFSFSDPLADGPIIQKATQIALENGVTTKMVIEAVAELRKRGVKVPLILMGYYNPILAYGLAKFTLDARSAGADGFIIPDLPPEEAGEFLYYSGDLPLVSMLAPTSPEGRIEKIARKAQGFIYLVSVTGVTGTRSELAGGIDELVKRIRKYTQLPVCVGFGISTPDQAREVGIYSDGVIVGSACVRAVGDSLDPVESARKFAVDFKSALKQPISR